MAQVAGLGEGGGGGKSRLTVYIFVGIVLAIVLALLGPGLAVKFKVGGEIFLMLLKMLVVPLVVTSVMSGILGMGDVRKLGRPGGLTVLYYLCTTVVAVGIGSLLVNTIQPGLRDRGGDAEGGSVVSEALEEGEGKAAALTGGDAEGEGVMAIVENLLTMLFTDNLFRSAASMDLLPLIVFSIIFAGMLTTMGSRVSGLTGMISQVNDALMAFILLLMRVAPVGIFCLVAGRFGEEALKGEFVSELAKVGWYSATVLIGLGVHAFGVLPFVYWFFTRRNPFVFVRHMSQAILTAFSTASSSATLPVTMECAQTKAGVSARSTDFVLPIGATINMDGTALYEAVAVLFIAQMLGMYEDLTLLQQLVIAMTATLAAIGAAGIPEAGLFTMIIVLSAVGLPAEGIGLILSVDWLLDRFRTAVNVFGDSVGAAVVDRAMPRDSS